MPHTEPTHSRRIDWPSWLALAWAAWFGVLYVLMILNQKTPGLVEMVRRKLGAE